MVCVVDTGMPKVVAKNKAMAPPVSAQKPPTDLSLVKNGKRHKNGQSHHLLDDLGLTHAEWRMANPVRGHLEHVFQRSDAPAHQGSRVPRRCDHVAQMAITDERHEDFAEHQKHNRLQGNRQTGEDCHG
jgi:hypothetical protein